MGISDSKNQQEHRKLHYLCGELLVQVLAGFPHGQLADTGAHNPCVSRDRPKGGMRPRAVRHREQATAPLAAGYSLLRSSHKEQSQVTSHKSHLVGGRTQLRAHIGVRS